MQLVERHIIHNRDPRFMVLDQACFHAKNIYNAATWQRRQRYIREKGLMSYAEQEQKFKQKDLLPDQKLPAKVVQQVLMGVQQDWNSFLGATQSYATHPEKFTGSPHLPRYKNRVSGRCTLIFTIQAISKVALRKGEIHFSGLNVSVKTRQRQIAQVRVVPRSQHCVVEVVYTVHPKRFVLDDKLYAGLDLGVDNLAALASNQTGFVPFLINGRPLKSINQYYNKQRTALQIQLPRGQYTSRRLEMLTNARNRRIDALLHLTSRYIISRLVDAGIGNLVIGKNDAWKQRIALGRHTNQNFVSIPHARFITMLIYKATLAGIQVHVVEEGYTSKCSFLDGETLGKHETYLGKRIGRGLFRTGDGCLINADLNAAYNIIRKIAPNAFEDVATLFKHGKSLDPIQIETNLRTARARRSSGANGASL